MSEAEHWLEPEEQQCRLLLEVAAGPFGTEPQDALEKALARSEVAGLLLDAPDAPEDELAGWRQRCHEGAAALLLVDRIEPAASGLADGVHLRDWRQVGAARQHLGENALIGAGCDWSRHAAMVAGENGADYVMFGAPEIASEADADRLAELCGWWSELFVLPCAAAIPPDPGLARRLARAGAGFVVIAPDFRESPAEALETIAILAAAIAAADGEGNGTS